MAKQTLQGAKMKLTILTKVLGCMTDVTFTPTTDLAEATCADSGEWKEFIRKLKSFTLSFAINVRTFTSPDLATNVSYRDILDAWNAGTDVAFIIVYGDDAAGGFQISGTGIIQSAASTGGINADAVTAQVEMQGTGALIIDDIA